MQEIELKFGIPLARLADLRTALESLGADLAHPQILQAAYFDTIDRRLAQARSALRVRREDDDWVQTFKSAGINAMMRVEDNQPAAIPSPGQALAPDLSRHQDVARETLMHHLDWAPDQDPQGTQCGLVALYRTDLRRTRDLVAQGFLSQARLDEAARAALAYGFSRLSLRQIVAFTATGNLRRLIEVQASTQPSV